MWGLIQILENALSLDLFELCREELSSKLTSNVWRSSTIVLDRSLRQGISGSTLNTHTSLDIKNAIKKEISPHVPECEIVTQYYVWQPHSGIAMHDDSGRRFGATIYLFAANRYVLLLPYIK